MKYLGSKARIAKSILNVIFKDKPRNPDQYFVEPFAGGLNLTAQVKGKRIANDINQYLIPMWQGLLDETFVPSYVEREEYNNIRKHKDKYEKALVGWVGFNCSYSGKFFGGYAGKTTTKEGTVRDYQREAIKHIKKQIPLLKGVELSCMPYYEMAIPQNSIVYCDPPYEGTTKYNNDINHTHFWQWCRDLKSNGHSAFISEYSAPNDFKCIWQQEVSSSLSANGQIGGNKKSVEKLFTLV